MNKKQQLFKKFLIKNKKIKPSKKITSETLDNIFNKLSEKEIYELNKYILKETEEKKYNYLFCNEVGRLDEKKETIFDYKNLYEWDKKWWEFQKASLIDVKNETKYKKWYEVNYKEYNTLYMQGEWFRWIEEEICCSETNETMYYGILEGLKSYIVTEITERIDKWINKKIPNQSYKPYQEDLFKETDDGMYEMAKMEIRAGGKEKQLELLKEIYRENFPEIEEEIIIKIKPYENYTFSIIKYDEFKKEETIENALKYIIIGGLEAAKNISFKSLLKDTYKLEQPYGIVENLIERIWKEVKKKYLKKWLKESAQKAKSFNSIEE
jgi:hypothetical protein